MGRTFPDAVKGGGGRSCQSLRSTGQSSFGLSWRADSWYQPSTATATTTTASTTTATTIRPSVVGIVDWSDFVRGGASSAAVGRYQLTAKSDMSRRPTTSLSVAARPSSPSILPLSYDDRPQVLDTGCAVAVAVQKGHSVAHR